MKQTVVFDFDGVIHAYSSGWKSAENIPDPPVDGIKEAIEQIREAGYRGVVSSSRCQTESGTEAVEEWLEDHGIVVDDVTNNKPPAIVYIDDRAITFDGHADTLLDRVRNFKPWNKK